ncbi:peptidylprolyl isomerase PrsA [Actinomadura rudentiformis]|uniref:Uncharacterized protein n=1 Tax=Actinomadura rudentiformis TaxID=359158 RepID=A0A6H9YFS7_9ACTN|nr:hypothetical protein [Actinomadura rudentiformis]KAB2340595.1 hypothetical protein F8566_44540 [Actinomadura rudentiformis]
MDIPPASTPVVCDMTTATDTPQQRLDAYQDLFGRHLIGRERTAEGIRFQLRANPGVEQQVRKLAEREKACCAFFAFDITTDGDQVIWDCAVSDNDTARAVLEEYYLLPETAVQNPAELGDHLAAKGLHFTTDPGGTVHQIVHVPSRTSRSVGGLPPGRPSAIRAGGS